MGKRRSEAMDYRMQLGEFIRSIHDNNHNIEGVGGLELRRSTVLNIFSTTGIAKAAIAVK